MNINELKAAARIADKYEVEIYASYLGENDDDKPAVLLLNAYTFKMIEIDGTSREDYCIDGFPFHKTNMFGEPYGPTLRRFQKISDGVKFLIDLPETHPNFEKLYAETSAYIDAWDKAHWEAD